MRIFDLINRRNDPQSVALFAACMDKSELLLDGRFGLLALGRELVDNAANLAFDLDSVIEPLRSVDGVEVVALIKERLDGGVKMSLRATQEIDVQIIARRFQTCWKNDFKGRVVIGRMQGDFAIMLNNNLCCDGKT